MTVGMAKQLYLIDGSGFIFRAYHALPPLSNPQGVPVGAVYGYVNMLTKLREQLTTNHDDERYIAVVFDAGRNTFRNRLYDKYKANRGETPEDLIPQFSIIREATDALCIPRIEREDVEADDVIATYALAAAKEHVEVVIISSDKDLMQLIGSNISMFDAMKQRHIGPKEVEEKFGVPPEKVLEVLSLIGDSSDNVPGVPGIGPKTAAELIQKYGTLENLLDNAEDIKQPKRRQSLIDFADQARLSKALVGLKIDVDVPDFHEFAIKEPDAEKLVTFLSAQGFKSLTNKTIKKHGLTDVAPEPAPASQNTPAAPANNIHTNYEAVTTLTALQKWIDAAKHAGHVAFDVETTSLDAMQAKLVGFSLCIEAGKACYVPIGHVTGEATATQSDMFGDETASTGVTLAPNQIPMNDALAAIRPLLQDPSVIKIGQNIKYDLMIMLQHGVNIYPMDDTMLLSYTLNAGAHKQGMDELCKRYLDIATISYDSITGTGKKRINFSEVEIEKAIDYAAEDADMTLRLWQFFKPQLRERKLTTIYETIERPLIAILTNMERTGIKVDHLQLKGLSDDFAKRMHSLESEIHTLADETFNVGSPKQLGEILFDKMSLEGGKKSAKSGAYTTDSEVLESLAAQGHELPEKVLLWRQLAKLKSTYTDALAEQINPNTKRVHTSYAMAITTTGRLSSSDPNLQNIPIRTEEGKKIRNTFIAESGYTLLSADYSQIELRLLAHMADIEVLKTAFKNGDDIHAITASQMFGTSLADVDSDLRRKAKTINFGIIYGISAHGLAMRLGIGRPEAATYIESYFQQYPGIKDYMERTKNEARSNGYVSTLFGRRCHLPGIHNKNGAVRQFAERAAINAPLQGTAADIIKRAMIDVARSIEPFGDDIRMMLQVHDELVFEVKNEHLETLTPIIKNAMESAAHLSIPLTVETGTGAHWSDAH